MRFFKGLDEFVFGFGSPVTIGLIRMLTGTLAFVNFAMIAVDFDAWFTERGFIPVWHAEKWAGEYWRLNLLGGVADSRATAFLYGLTLLACLATAVGLATRWSSIAMFVLIVTLHHRSPDILHSGDTLLRVMSFYVMVAPSGAALSLDRVVSLWKGRAPSVPLDVSLWPQRLVQFQVAVLYLTTVWHKWGGSHWRDGTATWFVPQLHEFDRFPVPGFLDEQPFVTMTTYGTLLVELAMATLVFAKPLRNWVLLSGVLLHLSIEYRFNIPLFAFVVLSTYVSFFSGEEIRAWWQRLARRLESHRLTVSAPHGMDWHPDRLAALKALDAFDLLSFTTGDWPGMVARDSRGRETLLGISTLARCPGAWALWLWLPLWRKVLASAVAQNVEEEDKTMKCEPEAARV